jgi:hypothetical protein
MRMIHIWVTITGRVWRGIRIRMIIMMRGGGITGAGSGRDTRLLVV